MRYRFGPSQARQTPALPVVSAEVGSIAAPVTETLVGINLLKISSVERTERVLVQVAPPAGPPPLTRPTRVFALYVADAPRDGVTAHQFMAEASAYSGSGVVPDAGPDGSELAFEIPVSAPLGAPFFVVTVIEYPGED